MSISAPDGNSMALAPGMYGLQRFSRYDPIYICKISCYYYFI